MEEMQDIVLSYPKLLERIEGRKRPAEEKKKALKNLKEIHADFSEAYISTFEKILDATLDKLYDGINFDTKDIDFPDLVKNNCVVLVPNHQSHADYLAINYMVYKKYRFPLYVAGGANLNIFPIGTLFRKSGCFFIRRSFSTDILYKLTLEAYLYYLLMKQKPIEFFFEGGRSRTGKLLPPRFGLYTMLLEAHAALPKESKAPLVFCPVSIVHEYVPEQKSLVRELRGGKKVKESSGQLFGLLKLFAKQFGNVHINLGKPIQAKMKKGEDFKNFTHDLAFKCFREVGKQMMVTPTSLLALVLLDELVGALTWQDILAKARLIIDHCERFKVPYVDSLKGERFEASLERAIDILIGNKKVDVIGKGSQGQQVFYGIKEDSRAELLYFKNTILHHFMVPWVINKAWMKLFSGSLNDVADLKQLFLDRRNQLKHEFYLPTVKEFFFNALKIVSHAIGRKINSLEDCLTLTHKELYSLAKNIGIFSHVYSYIDEAYYISGLSLKILHNESSDGFKFEAFEKKFKEVFDNEIKLGRTIRYPESYSLPLLKSSLKFFIHQKLIENDSGLYRVTEGERFDTLVERYEKALVEQLTFNLRV